MTKALSIRQPWLWAICRGPQEGSKARDVLVRPDELDVVLRSMGLTGEESPDA